MAELVWFRNDLRTLDAPHLSAACENADVVHACFLLAPGQWRHHGIGPNHVEYLRRSLIDLGARLAELNIPLHVRTADLFGDAPKAITTLAKEFDCTRVHWGRDHAFNEMERDRSTLQALGTAGIEVREHDTQWVSRPGSLRTKTDGPYKVFTPFLKSWRLALTTNLEGTGRNRPTPRPGPRPDPPKIPDLVPGFENHVNIDDWPVGEVACLEVLDRFLTERAGEYGRNRDIPSIQGTSGLSPALACGALSPRTCVLAARDAMERSPGAVPGLDVWESEIAWRDFYRNIMFEFPRVSKDRAFRPDTEQVVWLDEPERFDAWCEGRTGYPIVDAAMRGLVATGWMHNRLRMVVSQFLSKHLLTDWRKGEGFFAQHLVDMDFASNNGGWQWSSSTGTDSAPYFRVFNPTTQGRRFDPAGAFIRRWIPEIAHLSDKAIHEPSLNNDRLWESCEYPNPIVDQSEGRKRAISAFAALRS